MKAKQNTARSFIVGPILDSTGAAKTDEVVGSIKVSKNGTVGVSHASSTLTHNHAGKYIYAANAGDFDTLGEVTFSLNSGTNDMAPVTYEVVPAATYDALITNAAGAANGIPIVGSSMGITAGAIVTGSFGACVLPETTKTNSLPASWPASWPANWSWGDATAANQATINSNVNAVGLIATAIQGVLTGITSLAQWLGLLAGKQTGNATARTELRATGAGSGTFDETTDSLEAQQASTVLIGTGSATVTSPVTATGSLSGLTIGDDYTAAHSGQLTWTVSTARRDLTGVSTVSFTVRTEGGEVELTTAAGTVSDPGGASQSIVIELPHSLTDELTADTASSWHLWDIEVEWSDGQRWTPINGKVKVLQDQTRH